MSQDLAGPRQERLRSAVDEFWRLMDDRRLLMEEQHRLLDRARAAAEAAWAGLAEGLLPAQAGAPEEGCWDRAGQAGEP